jgi:S-DNA-T family DNA segregation ATPase FtsK/SpoIIIE
MSTPRTKSQQTLRILAGFLVLALALMLLGSLFSYHFLHKKALGLLDPYLFWWVEYYLKGGGYLFLGFLLSLAGLLFKIRYFKKNLPAIFLWGLGVYLLLALLSFYIGRVSELTNWAGSWGSFIAQWLCINLGFLLPPYFVFFIIYVLVPYYRHRARTALLKYGLYIGGAILLFNFTLSYLFPKITLAPINQPELNFYLSGKAFLYLVQFLKHLIGTWGIFVLLLISYLSAAFLVFDWQFIKELFLKLKSKLSLGLRKRKRSITEKTPKKPTTVSEVRDPLETLPISHEEALTETRPVKIILPKESERVLNYSAEDFEQEFLSALDKPTEEARGPDEEELRALAQLLLEKLKEFEIEGEVTEVLTGPMITRFEFAPAPGIKIQRIESLADDLALSLKAERIRILAPIPGKAAVGIEIPNKTRRIVYLRRILESAEYQRSKSPLTFALGETITGEPYTADLREMPHVLIAGTTGSGKSVCINTMIASIIYRATPKEVRFLTIDPKQLELPIYNTIPHLLSTTTTEPKNATRELDRIIGIMEARYGIFANLGVRDIEGYNEIAEREGLEKKPYVVVIIDELADLMIRTGEQIEEKIIRLAQMSRAVGIHLVLATQRPSVDVITGLIKANFPCRIAFQVASKTDSRTILDMNGAEALLGRGDMLFLPPGKGEPIRLHCAFVSRDATKRVVDLWTKRYLVERLSELVAEPYKTATQLIDSQVVDVLLDREKASLKRKREVFYSIISEEVAEKLWAEDYHKPLPEEEEFNLKSKMSQEFENRAIDELFFEAARIVFRHREASVSMLQRRLDIGWARAGRIIDQLESAGIVGPYVGSKSRKVLVESEEELEKILAQIKTSKS